MARADAELTTKELQELRRKKLEQIEGKPVAAGKSNRELGKPIPDSGVEQLDLHLRPPRSPQPEYHLDGYSDIKDFQGVIANSDAERDKLSSLFTAWENIPKYNGSAISGIGSSSSSDLDIVNHKFSHDGDEYEMVLTPAKLQEQQGNVLTKVEYYPGLTEELVEMVLVKMAMDETDLYDDPNLSAGRAYGVSFSLSGLRAALTAEKKTRSYAEIVRSLNILNKCSLELRINGVKSASAPIFPELFSSTERGHKPTDPSGRWAVRFHPLISMAISNRNYRQYNIKRLLCTDSKAALFLSKMVLTQARNLAKEIPFRISYQEFVRHSGELNYTRRSDGIRKFKAIINSLIKQGTLSEANYREIRGWRNRIEDLEVELFGSKDLISEIKQGHLKEKLVLQRYEEERLRLEKREQAKDQRRRSKKPPEVTAEQA
ncbi:hypothetical protein [Halomonas sp. I5-271120]|uniref:hypothetical protein n=1 Tax=Halomonas sp. I5-271120 TaxID=3061632 RepID=UPI00271550F6|nr:hypothetical protein [Halomonas sp. I5-271120]